MPPTSPNICMQCTKLFASSYSLKRHLARKTPCTKSSGFACDRCGKSFKSNFYLDKHLNRKKPCLKITADTTQNQKNSQKADPEIKPKLEQKTDLKPNGPDLSHNIEDRAFNYQKEIMRLNHQQKLEIIKAKKEAILEVERERTSRKVQTPHVTNNYNNLLHLEIHELKILNATFPAKNIHDADLDCIKKIVPAVHKNSEDNEISEFMCKDKGLDEINVELIGKTYNNEALPTQRNMVYSDESKTFYVVKNSSWVESDFKNIEELLSQTLQKYYKVLCKKSASLTKPNKKSQEVYIKIKKYATADISNDITTESKNLEDVAMKALNRSMEITL